MAVTRLLMISPNAADLMLERVAPSLTEHVYFIWQSTSSPPRDSSLQERLHDPWPQLFKYPPDKSINRYPLDK